MKEETYSIANWYLKNSDEVLKALSTNLRKGLTDENAKIRNVRFGLNQYASENRYQFLIDFLKSFLNPLILLLIFASVISALVGEVRDFILIIGIIVVSSLVSLYQHKKAKDRAEKLKLKVALSATVIRNGVKSEILFSKITIGDVVLLSVGDIVPADCRILEASELTIDESTLTGESFPASKNANIIKKSNLSISQQDNMAFAGTHVLTGEATVVVVNIGQNTQFGELAQQVVSEKPQTSFDKNLNSFGILLMKATLALTIFVFFINAFLRHDLLSSFLFALALAVGLTPELLPVVLTITLSKGAMKMAKKEVIVKYLPAIQNLGSMNILCTDKTGTLTQNAIELSGFEDYSGVKNNNVLILGVANSYFHSGFENPLDSALRKHLEAINLKDFKKIGDIPYDFDRKRLSVILQMSGAKEVLMITKGSVLSILDLVSEYHNDKTIKRATPAVVAKIKKRYEDLSAEGLRVVAIATRKVELSKSYKPNDEKDLTFEGFITFMDPPKSDVARTVRHLEELGVKIKILTGDNEIVTKKVCSETNIPVEDILIGSQIDSMSALELKEQAEKTSVFARLTPDQKLKVINALKSNGNVVSYLGDGINDAPPLKAADVGISVSNGSDVARDTADIILMRKNLSVLKDGVLEGRATYANILKYIQMETSSNVGNMITVAISSVFLKFLPMLPIQILLNNFLYDLSQLAIPMDNVDSEFVKRPRVWDISFIRKFMLIFGPISSVFDFLTFIALLTFFHANEKLFHSGWFIESLITQALITFSIRTGRIPFFRSRPGSALIIGTFAVCLLAVGIVTFPTGMYFELTSLPVGFYFALLGIILLYFSVVEIAKVWFYRDS